jgi:hypothetical protein
VTAFRLSPGVGAGIAALTVLEASTDQIDNLILPPLFFATFASM